MAAELPKKSSRFLGLYISSVAELETLLLLYRDPSQSWNPQTVSAVSRMPETSTQEILERLASKKLLKTTGKENYGFPFEDEELRAVVGEISDLFETYRTSVIERIYSSDEKIKLFADSFLIKKDK